MKKTLLIVAALLLWVCGPAAAKNNTDEKNIKVDAIEVTRTGDVVNMSFSVHVGSRVVRQSSHSIVVKPTLRNGIHQRALSPIVIQGNRADAAYVEDYIDHDSQPHYTSNGQHCLYSTTFVYERWMTGSELILDGIDVGRGNATEVKLGLVADNLMHGHDNAPLWAADPQTEQGYDRNTGAATAASSGSSVVIVNSDATHRPTDNNTGTVSIDQRSTASSTADNLAVRFPFVEPDSHYYSAQQISLSSTTDTDLFDLNMPLILGSRTPGQKNEVERFVRMTQSEALSVRFTLGSRVISREFDDNNRALVELISVIRAMERSLDSKVSRVVVVGFSSPDGLQAENERLSLERAQVVKDFVTANSSLAPETVEVYGGSIDWAILRDLISSSNMAEKYKLLDIIDNTPVWADGGGQSRMAELKVVGNGAPFRYMQENFFPLIRQRGAYVKVYYENR